MQHFVLNDYFLFFLKCNIISIIPGSKKAISSEDFAVHIIVDGLVCKELIIREVVSKSVCNCKEKEISQMSFYMPDNCTACDICSWNKSLLLILFCSTGFDKPEEGSLRVLEELLEVSGFMGGIIGSGNSAYFMCGSFNGQFLYLDPHYVQEYQERVSKEYYMTYLPKGLRKIAHNKILPNLGLTFVINSYSEFESFWTTIQTINNKHSSDFFFCIEEYENHFNEETLNI